MALSLGNAEKALVMLFSACKDVKVSRTALGAHYHYHDTLFLQCVQASSGESFEKHGMHFSKFSDQGFFF